MKNIFLMFVVGAFFIASISSAQQKLTEEQAARLMQQYNQREEDANAKIKEEEKKIEELKKAITEVDERTAYLQSEIAKTKEEAAKPKYSTYVVREGDWLAKLAEYPQVYGYGYYALWRVIYEANKDLIENPTLIHPSWELKVPILTEEEKATRNKEILQTIRGK